MKIASDILVYDGTSFRSLKSGYVFKEGFRKLDPGSGVFADEWYILGPRSSNIITSYMLAENAGVTSSFIPMIRTQVNPIYETGVTLECDVLENGVRVGYITQSINASLTRNNYLLDSGSAKSFSQGKSYQFKVVKVDSVPGSISKGGVSYMDSSVVMTPIVEKITLFSGETTNQTISLRFNAKTDLFVTVDGVTANIGKGLFDYSYTFNNPGRNLISVDGYPDTLSYFTATSQGLITAVFSNDITSKFSAHMPANNFTSISGTSTMVYLDVSESPLTSIDVSRCYNLETLRIPDTGIAAIDVSKCTALSEFSLERTPIKSLGLDNNINLKTLLMSGTQIGHISVYYCTKIEEIDAENCGSLFSYILPVSVSLKRFNIRNTVLNNYASSITKLIEDVPDRSSSGTPGYIYMWRKSFSTDQAHEWAMQGKPKNWIIQD